MAVAELRPLSTSEGPELRATLAGTPTSADTPLVFIHGWPDNSHVLDNLLTAFSDRRCVLLDLPRCDGAAWDGADLSLDALATLAARTIKNEQWPVTIIAHDWGAYVASLLLVGHPELIEHIVLLDVGAQRPPCRLKVLLMAPTLVAYLLTNAIIYLMGRSHWLRRVADALNSCCIQVVHPCLLPPSWENENYVGRPTASTINYMYFHLPRFLLSTSYQRMNAVLHASPAPLLFLFGTPFFHDERWASKLASSTCPKCDAAFVRWGDCVQSSSPRSFEERKRRATHKLTRSPRTVPLAGHWFFHGPQGAEQTAAAIHQWLRNVQSAAPTQEEESTEPNV